MIIVLSTCANSAVTLLVHKNTMQANKMQAELRCCICKAKYQETNNLGSWRCYQHTGNISNGRWTCCNLSTGNSTTISKFYGTGLSTPEMGCIRCDHRVSYDPYTSETGTIEMPTKWYNLLKKEKLTSPEAMVSTTLEQTIIRRYDAQTQEKLEMVMTMHSWADGIPSLAKHRVAGSLSQNPYKIEQMLERI